MLSNIKYRVNTLAKDLSMRTKDLLDFMEKCGMQGKTSSAIITPEELAIILDRLTNENQTKNMAAYVEGKTVMPQKAPKAPKPAGENGAKPAGAGAGKPGARKDGAPAERRDGKQGASNAPKAANAPKTAGAPKSAEAPKANTAPKATEAPKADEAPKTDKFAKPNFASGEKKPQQKPAPKAEPAPAAKRPQTTTVQIKSSLPGESAPTRSTRIVDTRTTTVDLAKYDERLENFVPESARRSNMAPDRQKMKKQPQQNNPYAKREKGCSAGAAFSFSGGREPY